MFFDRLFQDPGRSPNLRAADAVRLCGGARVSGHRAGRGPAVCAGKAAGLAAVHKHGAAKLDVAVADRRAATMRGFRPPSRPCVLPRRATDR